MKTCGIYQIVNTINNKRYIGSSKNIDKRLYRHKINLQGNRHENDHLQKAWNLYGEKSFIFEKIIECYPEMQFVEEQYYIDLYEWDNLYNIMPIAREGGYNNKPLSIEHKTKIAVSLKGKKHSPERIEKNRIRNIGRKQTVQCITKRVISNTKYDSDFCALIYKEHKINKLSYNDIVLKYKLKNYSVVSNILVKYKKYVSNL